MSMAAYLNSNERPGFQLLGCPLRKHVKKDVVRVQEEKDKNIEFVRRWDEMNSEILLSIIKRLDECQHLYSVCFVCKSWLNAVLDALFPLGDLLDLSRFCNLGRGSRGRRFCCLLEIHMKREQATLYTKLLLPGTKLPWYLVKLIAKRLPSLKTLCIWGGSWISSYSPWLKPYWNELEEINCTVSCLQYVSIFWNQITRLDLGGSVVKEPHASEIAGNFPHLTHLSLEYCRLEDNALSIMLDGHKNLVYLNVQHAILCETNNITAKVWGEDLLMKASRITQFLRCAMSNCRRCCHRYRPFIPPRLDY